MNKKCWLGICGILLAALAAIAAVSLFGKTIQLNYIEQIHLQAGSLYYVDRGEDENLKILRSGPDGKQGQLIICRKHVKERYQMVKQIFFDDADNAYVLLEETNVESWDGGRSAVYRCDFAHGRLEETSYDLTEDGAAFAQIVIQSIQNGRLYYVGIPDSGQNDEQTMLLSQDAQGKRREEEEILLDYPNLNAQFFYSQDQILLWTDYAGEVFARARGSEEELEIEGITGRPGVFKSLSDDGKNAYVLDYEESCIRSIDLVNQTADVLATEAEIQKQCPEFSFQRLCQPDCTKAGFCAGVRKENGRMSICSYQDGSYRELTEISLNPMATLRRMGRIYGGIVLAAALLCLYWILRVRFQMRTILIRFCAVILLGLLVMDKVLEFSVEQSMRRQLESTQTISLSALGKILREDIVQNIELDAESFPSGDRALRMSHADVSSEKESGELSMYVYSIFAADEEEHLYVSESMSEYSGVGVEWVYEPKTAEAFYRAYQTGQVVNQSDENKNGRRNNQCIPLVLSDGTKYGVLVVSVGGNILDYQIWYFQWNLKQVSSTLLFVLTVVLLVILYIFLRPLKALKECAGKLAAGSLGETVAVRGHDEVADISAAFNQMSVKIAGYVQDIKGMSDGYYKFIPAKILDLLGKASIQEVELGDQTTQELTILSLHALDDPRQNAALSAEEVYCRINEVLSLLVEPINSHHGVVEHFEDTGLSSFFTAGSREAVDSAIEMQRLLRQHLPGEGRTIAISYGRVMIGVIGHEQRMEAAAMSVHSNLAKQLRLKGAKYGAHILITHRVYEQIADFDRLYHARYLGNIYLTATNMYERIYDVYDGDAEEEFYYKERTRKLFEQGVGLFVARRFYEARLVFVEVLKQHRKDKAAKEYLYRCDQYYKLASSAEIETVIERF